jgi:hypothetical protein
MDKDHIIATADGKYGLVANYDSDDGCPVPTKPRADSWSGVV